MVSLPIRLGTNSPRRLAHLRHEQVANHDLPSRDRWFRVSETIPPLLVSRKTKDWKERNRQDRHSTSFASHRVQIVTFFGTHKVYLTSCPSIQIVSSCRFIKPVLRLILQQVIHHLTTDSCPRHPPFILTVLSVFFNRDICIRLVEEETARTRQRRV